jgi:hypothetical protein
MVLRPKSAMPHAKTTDLTAHKKPSKKPAPAAPARQRRTSRADAKPVYITEDEADVLVSQRREREEELIPWEQVEAELD